MSHEEQSPFRLYFDREEAIEPPHQFGKGDRIMFRREGEPDTILVVTDVQEPTTPSTQTFTVRTP